MANPFGIGDLPSMGLPGSTPGKSGGLFETMELMRKAWTSFALPPSVAPTIDPEEVERRIAELKTVEQWLVMNLTMLRGTIQALEIQQNTLAALNAFGATSAAAMSKITAPPAPAPASPAAPAPLGRATAGPAAAARPAVPERPASTTGTGWAHPASNRVTAEAPAQPATPPSPSPADSHPGNAGEATGAPAQPLLPGVNPMAWWETLQQQFNQVAAAALANMQAPPESVAPKAKVKTKAGTPPADRRRKAPTAGKPAAGNAAKKRASPSARRTGSEG